jgi:hypothetical protein
MRTNFIFLCIIYAIVFSFCKKNPKAAAEDYRKEMANFETILTKIQAVENDMATAGDPMMLKQAFDGFLPLLRTASQAASSLEPGNPELSEIHKSLLDALNLRVSEMEKIAPNISTTVLSESKGKITKMNDAFSSSLSSWKKSLDAL